MQNTFLFRVMAYCVLLGVVSSSRSSTPVVRDAITERENFKAKNLYTQQSGFSVWSRNAAQAIIVLPDNPLPVQSYAARELADHIFKASGVRLPALNEGQIPAAEASRPRIYIGGVNALRTIGMQGATAENDAVPLTATQIAVVAPDTSRPVKEVSQTLWQASNAVNEKNERDGFIDLVLDLGQKRELTAITLTNRKDTATNYNIGQVEVAVGASDDGQNFERNLGEGVLQPAVNTPGTTRTLKLNATTSARYVRLRIKSNLAATLDKKESSYNVVWESIGFVAKEPSAPAPGAGSTPVAAGEGTIDPSLMSVMPPDTSRQVKEKSQTLWQATNAPDGETPRDGYIEIVLDLGAKRELTALTTTNRKDAATNYNIGRVQLAVGSGDDGRVFDRDVAAGVLLPAVNTVGTKRTLKLDAPVRTRYLRLRIESNLIAALDKKESGYNVVWEDIGYNATPPASAQQPVVKTAAGLFDLDSLPPNGFVVKSQGNALFLAGRDGDGPALQDDVQAGTLFAVYEWLERQAGVLWLWPGELGTKVPRLSQLPSGVWDVRAQPPLLHARLRQTMGRRLWIPSAGGFTAEQRAQLVQDEIVWMRRNRLARGTSLEYGHGYTTMWQRFSQTHPEYFNLLPDGTRRSDPYYHGAHETLISMSVADRGFQQQVIEDWKARRTTAKPWINGWENDTFGKCVCAACLAWDVKDPALGAAWSTRVENARRAFESKEADWPKRLGSMSDRYAKFYLALQQQGRAVDPAATVIGGAYANYSSPPLQTKLNRNIVVGVVPEYGWPMDDKTFQSFHDQWTGWHNAGASLYLRPNYTLWGHEQPIITAREYARDFQFAYRNGMIATDYDSLTSMWATQGLNLYVLTRLHWRPDWPVEKIMAEYYEAFGAAKNDVRRYFEYWETQTQRAAKELADLQREDAGAQLFGNWTNLHQAIGRLYTPENYATGARLLAAAHLAVADDATARQRIEFLQSGLEDARLVALASVANEEFKRTKDDEKLIAAIGVLDRARAQTAQRFPQAVNMDLAAWMENRDWNRAVYSAINSAAGGSTPVARLPLEWRLRWDENKIGEREAWFANGGDETLWQAVNVNAPWEKQAVGKAWRDAHGGVDYNGWAWYRVRFNVDAKWRNKKLTLLFGAVDEAATIYLNGRKIGTHPFINPNDWQTPFIVEASEAIKFDGENELVVLVEDSAGAGGVWKPVWLIAP